MSDQKKTNHPTTTSISSNTSEHDFKNERNLSENKCYGLCSTKKNGLSDSAGSNVSDTEFDSQLASMIDHTLLRPDASYQELQTICEEALRFSFATVCVNSANIPLVAELLKGSPVRPIAVVGFPLGAASSKAKAYEAQEAIAAGAQEIDMVINIGALKSKDYMTVYEDICAVVKASAPYPVKVILETGGLTHDEKVASCVLSKTAGAAFVKTSTGFGKGGATVEDIELMRSIVGPDMGVKASGGVRSREDALAMIKAGANRIGASASIAIVTGKKGNSLY